MAGQRRVYALILKDYHAEILYQFVRVLSIAKEDVTSDIPFSNYARQTPSGYSSRPTSVASSPSSRSPRLNGLLLALGDAISSEDEDDDLAYDQQYSSPEGEESMDASFEGQDFSYAAYGEEQDDAVNDSFGEQNIVSELSLTLCEDPEAMSQGVKKLEALKGTDDSPENNSQELSADIPEYRAASARSSICTVPSTPNNTYLLSPVNVTLPRAPFIRSSSSASSRHSSYDSIDGDGWITPHPFALTPPRSPALSSTFDLLASPFGSPSARVALSPRLGSPSSFFQSHYISGQVATASEDDLDSPLLEPIPPLCLEGTDLLRSTFEDDTVVFSIGTPSDTEETPELHQTHEEDGLTVWDDREDNPTAIYLGSPPHSQPVVTEGISNTLSDAQSVLSPRPSPTPTVTESMAPSPSLPLDASPLTGDVLESLFTHPAGSEATPEPSVQRLSSSLGVVFSPSLSSPTVTAESSRTPSHQQSESSLMGGSCLSPMSPNVDSTDQANEPSALFESESTVRPSSIKQGVSPSQEKSEIDEENSLVPPYPEFAEGSSPPRSSPALERNILPRRDDYGSPSNSFGAATSAGSSRGSPSRPPSFLSVTAHERRDSTTFVPPYEENWSEDPQCSAPDSANHVTDNSPTAHLAYLGSPADEQNDTLNSLYGAYSDFLSPHSQHSVFESPEADESHAVSFLPANHADRRSIVFTPPNPDCPPRSAPIRQSSSWSSLDNVPTSAGIMRGAGSRASGRVSIFTRENQDIVTMGQVRTSSLLQRREVHNPSYERDPSPVQDSSPDDDQYKSRWSQDSGYAAHVPSAGRLKPLRLSTILSSRSSSPSSASTNHSASSSQTTVSSDRSLSRTSLLSTSCSPLTTDPTSHDTQPRNSEPPSQSRFSKRISFIREPPARSTSSMEYHRPSTLIQQAHRQSYLESRCSSRLSEPILGTDEDQYSDSDRLDHTVRIPLRSAPLSSRPPSILPNQYALATPKPDLLFAIASNDVSQVQKVLDSGSASANDQVGPQCALAFTLCNDQLSAYHKLKTVKMLLAYGATPSALSNPELNPPSRKNSTDGDAELPQATRPEGMDPATKYHIARAQTETARKDAALLRRSFFRPLTRVRYDLIGQDRALEQLFKVLSINSQQPSPSPPVILFCGPSGHGKTFLAHRFASLLDVQSHTVNMTTVRSPEGLWNSLSMNPHDDASTSTLAEFLIENEGQRCVVVLDEIEKTERENLFPLLAPFELGRCTFKEGHRHVDVRKTIWLATSNIGHDSVFEYEQSRPTKGDIMSRPEYLSLTALLRNRVSTHLGPHLLSRVTCVLPFVPFTVEEQKAIAAEALISLGGEEVSEMSLPTMDKLVADSLPAYVPAEGARSLYRAVSNQLADNI